jgi:hypothetical protein
MPLARQGETAGGAVWRRAQWLDHEIRAGRAPTRQQLRERFSIAESCATQTIAFMRDQLHLPLEYDRCRQGYVYREDPPVILATHPGLLLSEAELSALRLAVSLSRRYLDSETTRDLETLATRLGSRLIPAWRRSTAVGGGMWCSQVRHRFRGVTSGK